MFTLHVKLYDILYEQVRDNDHVQVMSMGFFSHSQKTCAL